MASRPWSLTYRLMRHRRIDPVTGCWEWTGKRTKKGYGVLDGLDKQGLPVRATTVHRLAAYLWLGLDLLSSKDACHSCDNPPCWNPAHLFVGSRKENMQDCVRKGRLDRKLTKDQAMAIRSEYASGTVQVDLAAKFKVSQAVISSIVRNKTRTFA